MSYRLPDGGPVRVRATNTSGAIPTAAELEEGELALNAADGSIYYQTAAGGVASIAALASDSFVVAKPGDDLQAKYAQAKALTPNGQPISASNRAALLVFPGSYEINTPLAEELLPAEVVSGGQPQFAGLLFDAEHVAVIGIGSSRWNPSVIVRGVASEIYVWAENVLVTGLYAYGQSGIGRIHANSGGGVSRVIESCRANTIRAYPPDTFDANFNIGSPSFTKFLNCRAVTLSLGGSTAERANPFFGRAIDCRADTLGGYIQGEVVGGVYDQNDSRINAFQGRLSGVHFSLQAAAQPRSSLFNGTMPGAFTGTCTIANQGANIGASSPVVVTKASHGLPPGYRIRLATTGVLPTGLSTTTTYYVYVIDSNTFGLSVLPITSGGEADLSAKLALRVPLNIGGGGASLGSGDHSIVVPPGPEGGWYSYCSLRDGDFAST